MDYSVLGAKEKIPQVHQVMVKYSNFIASYYRQLSADITTKIHKIKSVCIGQRGLRPGLDKTTINFIILFYYSCTLHEFTVLLKPVKILIEFEAILESLYNSVSKYVYLMNFAIKD